MVSKLRVGVVPVYSLVAEVTNADATRHKSSY